MPLYQATYSFEVDGYRWVEGKPEAYRAPYQELIGSSGILTAQAIAKARAARFSELQCLEIKLIKLDTDLSKQTFLK